MSFTATPAAVPDRDNLPLKKRDQRLSSPSQQQQQQQQQQCDAATFKAPYPYKNHSDFKTTHTGPFQPVPRRVPALYQPWTQLHTSSRPTPPTLSAFREHHGWAEWREFNPLQSGWHFSHHYQHNRHSCSTPVVHPGHQHQPSLVSDGLLTGEGYDWEQLKTVRDRDRPSNGRYKGPYARRRERKVDFYPRAEKITPPSLSICLPQSPHEDQFNVLLKSRHSVSESPFRRVSPGDDSNTLYTSMKEDASISPPSSSSSSSPPNHFPWLLPHFVAGSLIELRDGRLRRVEHLQTEDFLLGSLACPDLRLSCCTVQNISTSPTSSSSVSRLLVLLHDLQSQELVDVYMEYPFFVRGQGWSSCSPQRTARLCGLQCRQLSVGDVCLALTPVSAMQTPPPATPEPKTSARKSAGGFERLKLSHPQGLPEPQEPAGGEKRVAVAGRRRHCSAPDLRHPGTNCM